MKNIMWLLTHTIPLFEAAPRIITGPLASGEIGTGGVLLTSWMDVDMILRKDSTYFYN